MASFSTSSAYTEIMAGPNLQSKCCHQVNSLLRESESGVHRKLCEVGIRIPVSSQKQRFEFRYGEKVEELVTLGDWICPKCQGICNCSLCRKKNGQQPTGILVRTAKTAGSSSVTEMLETSGSENVDFAKVEKDGVAPSSKNGEVVLNGNVGGKHNGAGTSGSSKKKVEHEEFQLPHAAALTSVAGVEMPSEDVGHALQFLEFCSTFGKVFGEKEDPRSVLHDLFYGHGHSSAVEFQIKLLFPLSLPPNAWLDAVRECVLESQYIWKDLPIDSLERIDGYLGRINEYDELDSSEKIRVLTFLCDEALGSQKLRKWIIQQHHLFVEEKLKARREKFLAEEDELSECCNQILRLFPWFNVYLVIQGVNCGILMELQDKITEPSPFDTVRDILTEADDMELLEARSMAPQSLRT
ncbi:Zinc-finger domain of monoamine-oxidase A repressor R1 [Dillenia turbinata]|uniref:Zinc-finger domain of monoamine-oxidase A repressor R1 n=1 Tax=Dillenia turbinata TaxID=194707 RepID=A0AAN8YXS7_9MAGN